MDQEDIQKEYLRFVNNYDFNKNLSLETEKPHLARWAYGACEEWIKDFENTSQKNHTNGEFVVILEDKKAELVELKQDLRKKFRDNKTMMEMLK